MKKTIIIFSFFFLATHLAFYYKNIYAEVYLAMITIIMFIAIMAEHITEEIKNLKP